MQMPAHACKKDTRRVKSRVYEGRVGFFPPFNSTSWTSWSWHHCFSFSFNNIRRMISKALACRSYQRNVLTGRKPPKIGGLQSDACFTSSGILALHSAHFVVLASFSLFSKIHQTTVSPALHGGHPGRNLSTIAFAVHWIIEAIFWGKSMILDVYKIYKTI